MKTFLQNSTIFKLIFIFLTLFFVSISYAQKTYTGVNNGNWNTATNWTPSGVPVTGDQVVIPTSRNVILNTSFTSSASGSITIQGTGSIQFAKGNTLIVNGTITFVGTSANQILWAGNESNGQQSTFTLGSGANLITANANGVTAIANASIQTNGSFRNLNLNPGANYQFNGAAAAQSTTGLPTTVNNLTFSGSGTKTLGSATNIVGTFSIATGVVANLDTFIHTAKFLSLAGSTQPSSTSYGGTGSPAATINATYFAATTGVVNVGTCAGSYSLTSTAAAAAICAGGSATINVANSTPANLPVGSYVVYYTLTGANTGSFISAMTVSVAGSGSFTTGTLANSGATTITINFLRNGCVSRTTAGNTASITINTIPVGPVIAKVPTDATVCAGQTLTISVTPGTGGAVSLQDEYQFSIDGGVSWSGWGTSIPSFAATTIASTTNSIQSRRTSTGSGCTTALGNTVSWTVSTTNTWTGGTSTAWATGTNWSCGFAPTPTTNVVIGTSTNDPIITTNVTINTLTINTGESLTVNSGQDLTVTDVITNNGTLTIENSGNLLQVNNVANTGSGSTVVKRNTNPLIRLDYTLWSSPVSGQNLFNFSPLTSVSPNIRFYTYDSTIIPATGTGSYQSVAAYATTDFAIGKGYLIRLPFNHPTAANIWNGQFTGVPFNGTPSPSVAITDSGDRFNAVGNPYPSPISIAQFATNNSANIESTLYFWRKTNNAASPSYCSWNTSTSTYSDNGQPYTEDPLGIIQTGQGFLVQAKVGASTLVFNNGQRIGDNADQFFRTPANATTTIEANRIWLNMTGATGGFSQSVVGYFTNGTLGVDDTDSRYFNDGPLAFTSTIANQDYVIQGRPVPFDTNDVLPMKYKVTTAGSYTIAIDHVDGIFSTGQEIFLRDNLNAVLHNLSAGAYTFTSDAGTFASRFEVVYQQALGVDNPTFNGKQVIIYKNEVNDFVITSGNVIMSSVKVFDIRGRLLLERKDINASQTTMNVGMTNEVLLVQITSEDGVIVTKKVVR